MKRLLVLLLAVCVTVAADDSRLSNDLKHRSGDDPVDVIIQYKTSPGERHADKIRQHRGRVKAELGLIRALSASLPARELRQLSDDPDVAYISADRKVAGSLNYATAAAGAGYAWNYGYEGAGIGVAVIDSGISPNSEFNAAGGRTSRIVYSQNFATDKATTSDVYGHGVHVASIIAGNGSYSTCLSCFASLKGMAPAAKLINLRVLDGRGQGQDSWVIAAIDTAIKLKTKYNIRVMNLSLGRPVYESYTLDPLCQAVERAWNAGIVVVTAAGNEGRNYSAGTDGYGTITAPGNDPYVITVGAMKTKETPSTSDDTIASYSSKGPTPIDHIAKPDLVAAGNRVVALIANNGYLVQNFTINRVPYTYYRSDLSGLSSYYYRQSGTSMAAAVVSGAVADLLEAQPLLTPDQVKARLMKTARKQFPLYSSVFDAASGQTYTSQYDVFTVGAGYLDLAAALMNTDLALLPAKSPTAYYDAATGEVHLLYDTGALWGSGSLWGSAAIWGSQSFVNADAALWGSGALWGSAALWGSGALWGSSSTQGFSALWGSGALWGSSTTSSTENTTLLVTGED